MLKAGEPNRVEQIEGATPVKGLVEPPRLDLQHHVVQDPAPIEENWALEDDANIRARSRHWLTAYPKLTAAWRVQAGNEH